jgi:hypothetical protein
MTARRTLSAVSRPTRAGARPTGSAMTTCSGAEKVAQSVVTSSPADPWSVPGQCGCGSAASRGGGCDGGKLTPRKPCPGQSPAMPPRAPGASLDQLRPHAATSCRPAGTTGGRGVGSWAGSRGVRRADDHESRALSRCDETTALVDR